MTVLQTNEKKTGKTTVFKFSLKELTEGVYREEAAKRNVQIDGEVTKEMLEDLSSPIVFDYYYIQIQKQARLTWNLFRQTNKNINDKDHDDIANEIMKVIIERDYSFTVKKKEGGYDNFKSYFQMFCGSVAWNLVFKDKCAKPKHRSRTYSLSQESEDGDELEFGVGVKTSIEDETKVEMDEENIEIGAAIDNGTFLDSKFIKEHPALAEALAGLPADAYKIMTMKFVDLMGDREIAEAFGVSPRNIEYIFSKTKKSIFQRVTSLSKKSLGNVE